MSSMSEAELREFNSKHKPIASANAKLKKQFPQKPIMSTLPCEQHGASDRPAAAALEDNVLASDAEDNTLTEASISQYDDVEDWKKILDEQKAASNTNKKFARKNEGTWEEMADKQKADREKQKKHSLRKAGEKFKLFFSGKNANMLEFHQYVPAKSPTIAKALKEQKLTSAVFHQNKAFFVSWNIPNGHKLDISGRDDMTLMVYTLKPAAAKSLVEDYMVCQNQTEDDYNEYRIDKRGETELPCYTLWKTNEPGSFGIGPYRLKEIQEMGDVKIQAFKADKQGKKGKELVIDKKGELREK